MKLESKSRKTTTTIALRSRVILVGTGLLGVVAFAAAKMDSAAANDAGANRATANSPTADSSTVKKTNHDGAREADTPDKPTGDAVGTIEGDAIALQGPMSVEVVHGQVKTMLRSGNDIRVKSGQAEIDLVEGGKIAICGPAHISVLKSGGSLTVALDTGIIRVHVNTAPSVTVYTPQIQAKPIAIGDGAQDALIGFDATGVMCVRAEAGAIRLEQQLTGQSVIVPQGGDILLNNGALEGITNTGGHCECEIQIAKESLPPPELSRMATPEEIRQRDAAKAAEAEAVKDAAERDASDKAAADKAAADRAAAQAAAQRVAAGNAVKPPVPWGEATPPPVEKKIQTPKGQEPVYQVFMPPLAFDAKAAPPADNFDPKFIVLVRRVRVKPTLIFKGSVEGETTVAKQVADVKPLSTTAKVGPVQPPNANGATSQAGQQTAKPATPPAANDSVVNRVRNYIRHLFS
ncbi:MAG TPA: hypothetical protein VMP12_01755 [Candidatus Sulfotelmatobacter sp.]|nr:hypothetical protein [Candidatus Sulfotelmatobacter sp.]